MSKMQVRIKKLNLNKNSSLLVSCIQEALQDLPLSGMFQHKHSKVKKLQTAQNIKTRTVLNQNYLDHCFKNISHYRFCFLSKYQNKIIKTVCVQPAINVNRKNGKKKTLQEKSAIVTSWCKKLVDRGRMEVWYLVFMHCKIIVHDIQTTFDCKIQSSTAYFLQNKIHYVPSPVVLILSVEKQHQH